MLCPYCSEYLRDDALRCRVCHGDLVLYRFLLAKAEASAGLERQARAAPDRHGPTQLSVVPDPNDSGDVPRPMQPARSRQALRRLLWPLAICILLLIVTYWFVGIVLRADGLPLRAISILVPLPLGIWFALHERPTHGAIVAAALAVPTLAMIGGRTVASLWTGEAFLHHDHSWDYLLGYWVSMAFSFLTGAYIASLTHRHAPVALQRSTPRNRVERRRELIARAKQLGPILGPIGTAVAAVVTGIGEYLGK